MAKNLATRIFVRRRDKVFGLSSGGGGGGGVTSVTGSLPITSSGGTTPNIAVNNATASTVGVVQPDNTTITISGGVISATSTGTVTSVGLTMDGVVFNSIVSGSPVTTSGTLAPALLTQTKSTVLAGPLSGSAATPTFRALASADLPTTVIGFDIGNGDPTTTQPNIITTRAAGSLTKCVITVTASDGSTDLSFKITQNGTDVFSADPTVTHGTPSGTIITYTALTSSPLAFAAGDKFQYTGLTGTSSWRVNVQME